jgi:hypothetical protein
MMRNGFLVTSHSMAQFRMSSGTSSMFSWKFGGGNGFLDLRERGFVVGPTETLGDGLLPGHGIVFLSDRFVVAEWTYRRRKEFSPLPHLGHVFDDLRNEGFVFLFSVLFIEDAIFLIAEAGATEKVGGLVAVYAEKGIRYYETVEPGNNLPPPFDRSAFVRPLGARDEFVDIHAMVRIPTVERVFHIGNIMHVESKPHPIGVGDSIPKHVFRTPYSAHGEKRFREGVFGRKILLSQITEGFFEFLRRNGNVSNAEILIYEVGTKKAILTTLEILTMETILTIGKVG